MKLRFRNAQGHTESMFKKLVSLLFTTLNTKLVILVVNLVSEDINTFGFARY